MKKPATTPSSYPEARRLLMGRSGPGKTAPPVASFDWDALWRSAEIVDGRNDEWRQILQYRTQLPDDAIRLASHGWTPELVVAARDNPYLYMDEEDRPRAHEHYPDGVEVPASVAAKLVLADETAKWHESRAALARNHRWMKIRRLAAAPTAGWSHQMIGDLIGLTRQRVRAIVQSSGFSDHNDHEHSRQIPLGVIGTGRAAAKKTEIAHRLQAARLSQLDNKSEDI